MKFNMEMVNIALLVVILVLVVVKCVRYERFNNNKSVKVSNDMFTYSQLRSTLCEYMRNRTSSAPHCVSARDGDLEIAAMKILPKSVDPKMAIENLCDTSVGSWDNNIAVGNPGPIVDTCPSLPPAPTCQKDNYEDSIKTFCPQRPEDMMVWRLAADNPFVLASFPDGLKDAVDKMLDLCDDSIVSPSRDGNGSEIYKP